MTPSRPPPPQRATRAAEKARTTSEKLRTSRRLPDHRLRLALREGDGCGEDDRRQEGTEGQVADPEADDDRGEDGEQGRRGQLPQGRGGADVDDGPVLGALRAVHDAGVLPELAPDLLHDGPRGTPHRPDGE